MLLTEGPANTEGGLVMVEHHIELPGSHRPAKADARRLRDADPQSQVEVNVFLRAPLLPEADKLAGAPLTREQFAAKYSSSPEDADKVTQVLKRFGLQVEEMSLMTHSMRVSGSVAAMEAAFQPKLGIYESASQG